MKHLGTQIIRAITGLFGLIMATVGSWLLYSRVGIKHHVTLPPAVPAERKRMVGRSVRYLSYYVDSSAPGRPLVLLHSINAAASSFEMAPLFDYYRGKRPVYALDLPGFGFSDRSDQVYTPDLYKGAILDFLSMTLNQPADVIALSLSSEFAAKAALERPDLFHSLALISPTGFTARDEKRRSQQAAENQQDNTAYQIFSFELWSQAFYDLLTSKPSIRYFLGQSFVGPVPQEMVNYSYRTAHQPNARYAPLRFVSGGLFTPDISETVYARLTLPVLVLYDQDNFVSFEKLPDLIDQNTAWRAERITPTRGLPQFEQMEQTAHALDLFWQRDETPEEAQQDVSFEGWSK